MYIHLVVDSALVYTYSTVLKYLQCTYCGFTGKSCSYTSHLKNIKSAPTLSIPWTREYDISMFDSLDSNNAMCYQGVNMKVKRVNWLHVWRLFSRLFSTGSFCAGKGI